MLNQKLKVFYEKVVCRLIMQYEEYLFLSEAIRELENERFTSIARVAKEKNTSISTFTGNLAGREFLKSIDQKISLYKTDLQRLSDEMTYPNHYIWMMYKDKAYQDTSMEIATLADLRRHCSPLGYICTIRFKFFSEYLKEYKKNDLNDYKKYPDNIKLSDFYNFEEITALLEDTDFLIQWKQHEYLITGDTINKWHTAIKK